MGEVAPIADLQAAFLRKAPSALLLDQAAYWPGAETVEARRLPTFWRCWNATNRLHPEWHSGRPIPDALPMW